MGTRRGEAVTKEAILLTLPEASKFSHIPQRIIQDLIDQGKVKECKFPGQHPQVDVRELQATLRPTPKQGWRGYGVVDTTP